MSQQNFSKLEQRDEIEDDVLAKIADVFGVPSVETIKNFDERKIGNVISSSFYDNSAVAYYPIYNPVDKISELYERMMKEKDGQIELLKSLLDKK